MKKMSARSLADLVRMSETLGLHRPSIRDAPNVRMQRIYEVHASEFPIRSDSYLSKKEHYAFKFGSNGRRGWRISS
jgi:hypothetical protein